MQVIQQQSVRTSSAGAWRTRRTRRRAGRGATLVRIMAGHAGPLHLLAAASGAHYADHNDKRHDINYKAVIKRFLGERKAV